MTDFIVSTINAFKLNYPYHPTILVIMPLKLYDNLTKDERFSLLKAAGHVLTFTEDDAERKAELIYGTISEYMLAITVSCPPEIEEAVYNICTATHNYRLHL